MKMPPYVLLNKELGETPLETIHRFKASHPEYAAVPATYAGRLDPMAEGALLVLLGEECKRKEKCIGLDKVYEIEVLLGIGSDTGDVLGVVGSDKEVTLDARSIRSALAAERGIKRVPYPVYSSKTVNGKPLFLYALEGTLDTISIPEHEETIYKITQTSIRTLSTEVVRSRVDSLLACAPHSDEPSKALGADFRIADVRASWDAALTDPLRTYPVVTLRVACASGTYMRSLAARIGTALGTAGLALSIRRTHIGTYYPLGLSRWKK